MYETSTKTLGLTLDNLLTSFIMKKSIFAFLVIATFTACKDKELNSDFTGNEIEIEMIPGTVDGNTTSGLVVFKERTNGKAQIEITLNNVLTNAIHPVHFHFGSLDDNGNVATFLTSIREENGVGKSVTILEKLDNDTQIDFNQLTSFNGSIKIHFEASGPMENEILASTNIGINTPGNEAYFSGLKSITVCNTEFDN
jgi:hypothetical protein